MVDFELRITLPYWLPLPDQFNFEIKYSETIIHCIVEQSNTKVGSIFYTYNGNLDQAKNLQFKIRIIRESLLGIREKKFMW